MCWCGETHKIFQLLDRRCTTNLLAVSDNLLAAKSYNYFEYLQQRRCYGKIFYSETYIFCNDLTDRLTIANKNLHFAV